MKGWLDKYGKEINANEGRSSAPDNWVGEGYSTQGRNYSPAWGGQFAMGGSLPGSVGFTYARTAGAAPSNGPYAKKTLPSAQNGEEIDTLKTIEESQTELADFYRNRPKNLRGEKLANKVERVGVKKANPKILKKLEASAYYNNLTDNVNYDPNNKEPEDLFKQIIKHEFGHGAYEALSKKEKDIIKNSIVSSDEFINRTDPRDTDLINYEKNTKGYFTKPTEFYTRRNLLFDQFELDPSQPITESQADEMVEFAKFLGGTQKQADELGAKNPKLWTLYRKMQRSPDGGNIINFMNASKQDRDTYMKMFNDVTALPGQQTPIAENGMTYYQHGLDWKPKSISKNGGWLDKYEVPKNQNAKYILPRYDMPRATSESTSLGTKIDEAALRQASIDAQRRKQGQIRKAEPDRSMVDKAMAIATNPMTALKYKIKGQDIPENFERGERNPLDYAVDIINPAGIAESARSLPSNIARGEFLQAGVNALSVLPIASEFANNPLVKDFAKTVKDVPRAKNIKEVIGRIGGIPLEKDIQRMGAQDVKALRQVQEIGRLRATNSPMADQMRYGLENNLPEEHFQKVFGRSKEEAQHLLDTGFGEQEAARSAGIRSRINLERPSRQSGQPQDRGVLIENLITHDDILHGADSEVRNIVGDSNIERASGMVDYEALSDEQLARLRDYAESRTTLTPEEEFATDEIMRSYNPSQSELIDVATEPFELNHATATPEEISNAARLWGMSEDEVRAIGRRSIDRSDRIQDIINRHNPSQYTGNFQDSQLTTPAQKISRIQTLPYKLNNKLENFVVSKIQNYPYYSGEVLEKVPSLNLSSQGNLKNVSKKVNFAPEGIQSGDVFTGSTNTSHSSYLPQLKQVFKYTKGDPQFLGYKPMNSLGFLSQYDYSGGDIAKYLNSEIDEQIKRGILPKDVSRPFIKGESVMLPHYGVKQRKKGGVIKDDNGYWNPDNWGRTVEIDSPYITMENVYEPLIGESKQTGEKKMMLPGKNYTFANTKQVIERPLNKKSKGWLDKYN